MPKGKSIPCYSVLLLPSVHLHIQLVEAANYAHKHRVRLKGDFPISIDWNNVDTWVAPNLLSANYTLIPMHLTSGSKLSLFFVNTSSNSAQVCKGRISEKTCRSACTWSIASTKNRF